MERRVRRVILKWVLIGIFKLKKKKKTGVESTFGGIIRSSYAYNKYLLYSFILMYQIVLIRHCLACLDYVIRITWLPFIKNIKQNEMVTVLPSHPMMFCALRRGFQCFSSKKLEEIYHAFNYANLNRLRPFELPWANFQLRLGLKRIVPFVPLFAFPSFGYKKGLSRVSPSHRLTRDRTIFQIL